MMISSILVTKGTAAEVSSSSPSSVSSSRRMDRYSAEASVSVETSLFAFVLSNHKSLIQHTWYKQQQIRQQYRASSAPNKQSSSLMSPSLSTSVQVKQQKDQECHVKSTASITSTRRQATATIALASLASTIFLPLSTYATTTNTNQQNIPLQTITDPNTYSSLCYVSTNNKSSSNNNNKPLPLIVFLHGAGKNELPISNLANPAGEHGGLLPSLIASGKAPDTLLQNFVVVCPYSQNKRSFYEEPRGKLLSFLDWFVTDGIQQVATNSKGTTNNDDDDDGVIKIDTSKIFLFGFSDGATLSVELLTTRKFAGAVIASYGFSGILPARALERLKGLPVWVLHCAEDVIFDVRFSDLLVASLRKVNGEDDKVIDGNDEGKNALIRYTRYEKDQEGFTGRVKGHSVGITASKNEDVYRWLLSI
eukprot:CAMPEP_0185731152 /NCGR_PEP_ID=MMETSP1171-20130828/12002_1 /TAXON_ID=374046 /ORGANISM="Helicotheca tamensis, Strain CCMP826" /LENGTH=420 /DNA_ID=CAMNT_0028400351 /DNA_START=29 /DNA_END=1294 /DNA_ORIENTATION=+